MAKEKDTTLSKEERKAFKKAEKEKEKKRSDTDGVHKSKDKKEKKKDRAALAEKVANAVEKGTIIVEQEAAEIVKSDVEEDEKKDVEMSTRPVGALVPFANPLADEKVARKVFKGVKKGVYYFSSYKLGVKRANFSIGSLYVQSRSYLQATHNFADSLTDNPVLNSRSNQITQTRRQRSRQSAAQIPHNTDQPPIWHRRPRR
jgi:hypothetical protein